MSTHNVAEARNRLSALIDRALCGEDVVITRHGRPAVALKPVASQSRPLTQEDIDWVVSRRRGVVSEEDAGALVSRMRDEEWR